MRNYITLVESMQLDELERGGDIDSDHLDYLNTEHDFQNQQLDLFKELPGLDPQVPKGFTKVGRIGEFTVLRETKTKNDEVMIVLIDKSKAISWVAMYPLDSRVVQYPTRLLPLLYAIEDASGLQVIGVYVDEKHRGQKLGQQMYLWVLNNICDFIVADETHTSGGEALWRSLVKSPQFDVEVFNPDTRDHVKARGGKAWDLLYTSEKSWNKIPWVTLAGKSGKIRYGE